MQIALKERVFPALAFFNEVAISTNLSSWFLLLQMYKAICNKKNETAICFNEPILENHLT